MKGEIELIYVILEYTGILLFVFLLGHCISKSINYTLQIFCVVAIFNNINESILLFFHDHDHHQSQKQQQQGPDDVGASAYGTQGCTISAFFEQLLPLMMNCLATCMAFNIWYLIVLKARYTERELVKWYAGFAVLVAGIPTCVAAVLLKEEPFFSAYPRQFYCNLADGSVTRGTFVGLMLAVAIPGILLSLLTVVYLVQHYIFVRKTLVFTLTPSSNVVVELSHCIRLIVFCLAIGVVVMMAVLQALVDPRTLETMTNKIPQQPSNEHSGTRAGTGTGEGGDRHQSLIMFSEFSGSLVGFFAFLVFGTTHDALETMGKMVCCRFRWWSWGRDAKDRRRERRLEEFQGQQGEQGHGSRLGYGFFVTDVDDDNDEDGDGAVYYKAGDLTHDSNENAKNNRNYTDMYLGNNINSYSNYISNNNNNKNNGQSDYGYPCSESLLPSTQFRDKHKSNRNSASFDNRYAIINRNNNNNNNNNTTTSATSAPTPMANATTTTASCSTGSNSSSGDNSNITRKKSMNTSNRHLSIPFEVVGPRPPQPLKPLPERPTFQELMMHDFYQANSNERHSINRSSSRRGRGRSNTSSTSSNDLESGLSSVLLQPPPPAASLLPPPPPTVYSPK